MQPDHRDFECYHISPSLAPYYIIQAILDEEMNIIAVDMDAINTKNYTSHKQAFWNMTYEFSTRSMHNNDQ